MPADRGSAPLCLVADIGGTNTRVALADGMAVREASIAKFRNRDFTGIDRVLAAYVAETGVTGLAGACVAAAGPVQDGAVTMTNLFDAAGQAWIIDRDRVTAATGASRVAVLNDLQAQGQALGHIAPDRLRRVIDGPQVPGAMLVVGLGTGVNAAPVHAFPGGRVVPPSECGHVNLPVRDAEGFRLLGFVERLLASRGEVPHAGVEEVLSGRGLANLHAFAAAEAGVAGGLDSAGVLAALAAGDPVAEATARIYVAVLGRMLADQALIHLPYGGIFLIGGMARAMTPAFVRFGLTAAFREDRRVPLLLRDFSVSVVEDDFAALTGCAAFLAGGQV
jgi:glucokinase